MKRISILRLKLFCLDIFTNSVKSINEKNLNSEIETNLRTVDTPKPVAPTINEKNLNSEIETCQYLNASGSGFLVSINDKNLNSEIETNQRALDTLLHLLDYQ